MKLKWTRTSNLCEVATQYVFFSYFDQMLGHQDEQTGTKIYLYYAVRNEGMYLVEIFSMRFLKINKT